MRFRWFWIMLALCGASALFVGRVVAQEEQEEGCACGEEMEGCGEEKEAPQEMPAWVQLTDEHKAFQKMVGEWDTAVDFTPVGMAKSKGTASTKIILNGRFVQQQVKGEMDGTAFDALLHIGYDTVGKQYVSTWMDSVSPFLYVSRGTMKDGELSLTGKQPNQTGTGFIDSTTVTKWINDDTYTVTFFMTMGEKKVKTGVITYTRKK